MNRVSLLAGCLCHLAAAAPTVPVMAAIAPAQNNTACPGIAQRRSNRRAQYRRARRTRRMAGCADPGHCRGNSTPAGKPNPCPAVRVQGETARARAGSRSSSRIRHRCRCTTVRRWWKVRPFLNRNEVETYHTGRNEIRRPRGARSRWPAGRPSPPRARRSRSAGTEPVEGHPAYKLKLTLRNGVKRNLWIDAGTFLELKMEGEPRKLDGRMHKRRRLFSRLQEPKHGLTIPRLQETAVEGVKQTYKMTISRVAVNEPMGDSLFQKPQLAALADAGRPSSPSMRWLAVTLISGAWMAGAARPTPNLQRPPDSGRLPKTAAEVIDRNCRGTRRARGPGARSRRWCGSAISSAARGTRATHNPS